MKRHPWLYPHFKKFISNYRISQDHYALLIQTIPGMGDDILIYAMSCFLMCQNPVVYQNCGRCRSCQLMQLQAHPDYYILTPDKKESVLDINIVRKIREKIYTHSYFGGTKIVWLKNIAYLTEVSASSFFKILEEPPERTWFFLSYYGQGELIITLRSRCRVYYLNAPNEIVSINWLAHKAETISSEIRLTALRLCGGAPIAALEQMQPKIWAQRELLCSAINSALHNKDWLFLLKILDHEQILQRIYWLISIFFDVIKIQKSIKLLSNLDILSLLEELAKKVPSKVAQIIFYDICKVRRQLLTIPGLNRELLLTNLLLRIEEKLF